MGNRFVSFSSHPAKIVTLLAQLKGQSLQSPGDRKLCYSDKHVFDSINVLAILGVHGMLTQNQSHYAEKQEAGKALRGSGLKKYKPGELRMCAVYLNMLRDTYYSYRGLIL